MPCPACKIIIDGGRIAQNALDTYQSMTETFLEAFELAKQNAKGELSSADLDQWHAVSELICHQAKEIRRFAEIVRVETTKAIGGEYHEHEGTRFVIDGVNGIKLKE